MNSQGNTRVSDVADYLLFEDGLNKRINNAPSK